MLKDLGHSPRRLEHQQCGGCGCGIRDRFYLVAADRAWHGACLRCCQCSQQLDAELSCFCRDGNIYCKEDYFRLFPTRRCDRCGTGLCASELVMRARDLIFHVGCFSCTLCGAQLSTGDTAAIRGGRVLCADHCDVDVLISSESNSMPPFYATSPPQKGRPRKRKPNNPLHSISLINNSSNSGSGSTSNNGGANIDNTSNTSIGIGISQPTPLPPDSYNSNSSSNNNNQHDVTGQLTMDTPQHTELPLSSLDLSYDGSQSPGSGIGSSGGGCGGGGGSHLDSLGHGMGMHTPTSHSRSKRMRTSFKHHQLRTMKSYFAINQNPDAKDLKQLAQKTGLSKRVLQVWFQNARAKWRRNVMRQDGPNNAGVIGMGGSGLVSAGGSISLHNMAGSLTPHTSGGPPSVQSSASSSNMDGSGSGMTPSHALEEMHHMTFAELY